MWDKQSDADFTAQFTTWSSEFARILRDGGAGYVFCADHYLSHLWYALESAGLTVHCSVVWHKTNPGTQVMKVTFRSACEFILYFTKGKANTFNWQGENEMHNFIESPICQGNERAKTPKGETLHPTQKPERVIQHFMEISSNRGDTVFDGFMGVGTAAAVAKRMGRKFIGIEQDAAFFDAAKWRMN